MEDKKILGRGEKADVKHINKPNNLGERRQELHRKDGVETDI